MEGRKTECYGHFHYKFGNDMKNHVKNRKCRKCNSLKTVWKEFHKNASTIRIRFCEECNHINLEYVDLVIMKGEI
ncbi:MAG: hypothetical protein ACFFG0_52105 [Candidatus Thorarchaeota archaeon]